MERLGPTDIDAINERARSWAAPGETIQPIAIDRIVIEADALEALADLVWSYGRGGPALVVADHTSIRRGGDDLKLLLQDRLSRVATVEPLRLPESPCDEYHPTATDAERLAEAVGRCAVVISVGSGSVTDVVKYARTLAAQASGRAIPFICFPTAASVTAYTSAIAVLTKDGCKRNFLSQLPEAIVCDLRTLADAPMAMTQAGFGDVLARSVAYGDWFLARELGMDDLFSLVPNRLLEPAETAMIQAAERIPARELDGVRKVTEALLLAGVCMSVINHTAPISGWEHVISHYLDMTAEHERRAMALHGGQVAVGSLIAARAYEQSWASLDTERLRAELTAQDQAAWRRWIGEVFGPCDPTGRMAAEVLREYESKMERWRANQTARDRFVARKRAGELDEPLRRLTRSAAVLEATLGEAGGPRRFAELDRPIPTRAGHDAVLRGHWVRSRFTLGDVLDRAGWLTDQAARSLVHE